MKYLSVGMLILSGFVSLYFIDNGNSIFAKNYLSAKEQSNQNEKSLLLLFVTDECRVCEDQQDMMSGDDDLVQFIQSKFESAVVNINDFDGKAIRDYYQVKSVPSMVLVNQKGEVKWSHDGNISKSNLMNALSGNQIQPQKETKYEPMSATPSGSTESSVKSNPGRVVVDHSVPIKTNQPPNHTKPLISYQIQFGFFGSLENANKMVEKLVKTGQSDSYIKDEVRDGKKYFRVLSPMYAQMDIATEILNKMKSKGIDGQVKTIN